MEIPIIVEDAPDLVLVLGPHRSGSSITTKVLQLLGLNLGNNLVGADPNSNPLGHFEEISVLEFNEKILLACETNWMDPVPLKENKFFESNKNEIKSDLDSLLEKLIREEKIDALKEPRISMMLDLWEPVLEKYFEKMRIVITIRHPSEVAASLEKRDGMSRILSHQLWAQSMINILSFARAHPNYFMFYDHLISDTENEVSGLAKFLGKTLVYESNKEIFQESIFQEYRHHVAQAKQPAALTLSTDIYNFLLSHKHADEIIFSNKVLDQWKERINRLTNEINTKKIIGVDIANRKAVTQERDQLTQERDQLTQERDQLTQERDQLTQERNQLTQERDQLTQERNQLTQERNQLTQERDQLTQERDLMYNSRIWRSTKLLRLCISAVRNILGS
jgi:hypothetical protein